MEMALFNKRPAPREVHAPIEAGSYLGQGSKVRGKLNFEGPARIDGQIDGEIIAKDSIMIGEGAVVTGPIKAASVIVAGKVSGDIIASPDFERLDRARRRRVRGLLCYAVRGNARGAQSHGASQRAYGGPRSEQTGCCPQPAVVNCFARIGLPTWLLPPTSML